MIEDFKCTVHQLCIYVHGILVKPVIEVLCQLFVLSLAVCGVLQVILQKWILKNVFWLDQVNCIVPFHAYLIIIMNSII